MMMRHQQDDADAAPKQAESEQCFCTVSICVFRGKGTRQVVDFIEENAIFSINVLCTSNIRRLPES
jgi:hypothetical protein